MYCVCVVLYLCLVDEENYIGDCVDCHVDAQLNRPTVTDPRPETHTHTQSGSKVTQKLADDKKEIHKHTPAHTHKIMQLVLYTQSKDSLI